MTRKGIFGAADEKNRTAVAPGEEKTDQRLHFDPVFSVSDIDPCDNIDQETKQTIDRIVKKCVEQGRADGYFDSEKSAQVFENELKCLLAHRIIAFDSSIWRNVGTDKPQRVSKHFILSVNDSIESIYNWYLEEAKIIKRGSDVGTNLSRIRDSREELPNGAHASGPVSFMRVADAAANVIAGGDDMASARKMAVLDVDHPDIESFIDQKNTHSAVRVSDEFMKAVEIGAPFALRSRLGGDIIETIDARDIFHKIAEAAWAGDSPNVVQYDSTINAWHSIPNDGKITASSPNSEFMSIDNSSCVHASIDILKFLNDKGKFDINKFIVAMEIITAALDLILTFGDFLIEKITINTRKYRQLGLSFSNFNALFDAINSPYDSEASRNIAAAITSLMTAVTYRRSAEIAMFAGAYEGYKRNAMPHTAVIHKHATASLAKTDEIVDKDWGLNLESIIFAANREWASGLELGADFGWRNSQASFIVAGVVNNETDPMAQIRMMAAVQPFLSGAISGTIKMPESATVEDIEKVYLEAWKLGLKVVNIDREKSEVPVDEIQGTDSENSTNVCRVVRRKLPNVRTSRTYSYDVAGAKGYIIAGSYPDGNLGEIFLKSDKQASTEAGLMEALSIAVSIALQYGVPLEEFTKHFIDMRFDPMGATDDPEIPTAQSLIDYIFRRLVLDYDHTPPDSSD
ncbi:hypothetical protein FWF74_01810 [Candidatus Saccharibacteria bacterium]|nr:hypothetical protein [Candidatus Saccharibacteria bacterium]MCL1963082.1 hypothetical protein [Candidatus Saccharibacteria bacterium]